MFFNFLVNLNTADYIQISILIALVWYSWETHQLKKWQKKQIQLSILELEMKRKRDMSEGHSFSMKSGVFPSIIRNIYELGKFDPKELYSPAFHQPLTRLGKLIKKLKNIKK